MKRSRLMVGAVLAWSCHNPITPNPANTDPGFVTVTLTSPYIDAGAVQLNIAGPGVDSLVSPLDVYVLRRNAGESSAIVVGPVSGGEVLQFWVPDRNELSAYTAAVIQAAQSATYAQLAPAAYTIVLGSRSD